MKFIEQTSPIDSCENKEINRSRIEHRKYQVYSLDDSLDKRFDEWRNLRTVITVSRNIKRQGKTCKATRYFISSKVDCTADEFAYGIRSHWFIENKLHWVKDTILNEDKSLVIGKQLAKNMSLIRSITMNVFKLNNEFSIKTAIEKYTNRLQQCLTLMKYEHI